MLVRRSVLWLMLLHNTRREVVHFPPIDVVSAVTVVWTRMPAVEVHQPVVTYLQFPIQVCFPGNDHAQPAKRTWHHSMCQPRPDHAQPAADKAPI